MNANGTILSVEGRGKNSREELGTYTSPWTIILERCYL